MTDDRLDAYKITVHWGFFDATPPPVLTVSSGDIVTVSTVGGPEAVPATGFQLPDSLRAIHSSLTPKLPRHICTGPVAVRGPGQVLEVRLKAIDLHYDQGFTYSAPQKGALPDDLDEVHFMHIALDRLRMKSRTT